MKKTLLLFFAIPPFLLLSSCTPGNDIDADQQRSQLQVTTFGDGDFPYEMGVVHSCANQEMKFDEIKKRASGESEGTDVGVFFTDTGACGGVWYFNFVVGALLENVDPDLGSKSFALVRQEGENIFVVALKLTTGWDITSYLGGEKTEWLGLPAIKVAPGQETQVLFTKADQDTAINLSFKFSDPIGKVVVNEL